MTDQRKEQDMFRAIGRWISALGYLLTGRIDKARESLDRDPAVIRARYDRIKRETASRIQEYMSAVGTLVAQNEKKKDEVKRLEGDAVQQGRIKEGAAAMAKARIAALRQANPNITKEQIQQDLDYMKCIAGYNDASSTLKEKEERIASLKEDITANEKRIAGHVIQLQDLKRELEHITEEAAETVADVITATQEKQLNDVLAGVSHGNRTAEERQGLQDLRRQVRAEAKVSSTLAGTDHKVQTAEFLEYARKAGANDVFEKLVGLDDAQEKASAAPVEETRVAEGAGASGGPTPAGFPE